VYEHAFVHSTNRKGAVAEAKIVAEALDAGVSVLTPVAEHGHYDLAFDVGERILRVQCKWGALDREKQVICTRVGRSRHTPRGYVLATYGPSDIGRACHLLRCAGQLLPGAVDLVTDKYMLHLRVGPPQNHQRAALHYAADHLLPGAIAQLGERSDGIRKGVGSSPTGSTPTDPAVREVGAHEFRNHFGYYMERAAAGEEILVTRRGKPHARLGPPAASQPELDLASPRAIHSISGLKIE
jgi:prevent-host-death family protein